jgi:hypothetical protein
MPKKFGFYKVWLKLKPSLVLSEGIREMVDKKLCLTFASPNLDSGGGAAR